MGLHRLNAQESLAAISFVDLPSAIQLQDLHVSFGQISVRPPPPLDEPPLRLAIAAVLAIAGLRYIPPRLIASKAVDGSSKAEILKQISGGSGLQNLRDIISCGVHGEDDHLDLWQFGLDLSGRLNPIQVGHRDIHNYDIGMEAPCQLHSLITIIGLSNTFEAATFSNNERSPSRMIL